MRAKQETENKRIQVTITDEQWQFLLDRFGESIDQEKGAEVRRWYTLGWIMAQSGAQGLAGPRVDLAKGLFGAPQEVFKICEETFRNALAEKLRAAEPVELAPSKSRTKPRGRIK